LDQEEQVGNGFQWIVDLVSDGCSETSGSRKLFAAAKCVLGELTIGYVHYESDKSTNGSVLVKVGRVIDKHLARTIGIHVIGLKLYGLATKHALHLLADTLVI